jgi:hypothetical protein
MTPTRDQIEAIGERAAIREFDGGLARADAERHAWIDVLGTVPTRDDLTRLVGWLDRISEGKRPHAR